MNRNVGWKQTFCHGQKRGSLSGLKAAGEEEEEALLDAAAVKDPKQEGLSAKEAICAIDLELENGSWKRKEGDGEKKIGIWFIGFMWSRIP